jgi:uncharacterized repeat protein (TIGR01451 family)
MTKVQRFFATCLAAALVANVSGASAAQHLRVHIVESGLDQRRLTAAGQTSSIAIGVSNAGGTTDANDVVLTISLPASLRFQNASRRADKVEEGKVQWNLGTLKAGEPVHVIELEAKAGMDVPAGSDLIIDAEIAGNGAGVDAVRDKVSLRIRVDPLGANLAVASDLRSVGLWPGRPATFSATVVNLGTATAAGTALAITLPRGMRLNVADPKPDASADAGIVNWALGDLQRGEARTIAVTVDVDPRLEAQLHSSVNSLSFSFDASSSSPDIDPADNHLKIVRGLNAEGHDVAVWLNIEGGPGGELKAGKEVTLVLIYANLGHEDAHKTVVTLRAPAASGVSQQTLGNWEIGDVRRGAQGMIRVPMRLVAGSQTLFTAEISADGRDANTENNIARSLLRESRASVKTAAAQVPVSSAPSSDVRWLLPALSILALLFAVGLAAWWWMRKRKA